MSDRCVILGRERASSPWELLYICESRDDAFKLASGIEDQEHNALKEKGYRCIVVSEDDYDAKNYRPLKHKV